MKAGTLPADAPNQGAIAEELSAIDVQHREQQSAAHLAARRVQPAEECVDDMTGLTVDAVQPDSSRGRVKIRLSALSDDKREFVLSALQGTRKTIAANIVLINKGSPLGLGQQLAQTALGQLCGSIDLATPARSKHVAIFFDVKCSRESTGRPNLRIPPLQRGKPR